ncbi:MAG: hypothetical protein VYA34_06565 [Myxococcota bacterium]|nr:hypothetical protein [Myxococcota bacterium]
MRKSKPKPLKVRARGVGTHDLNYPDFLLRFSRKVAPATEINLLTKSLRISALCNLSPYSRYPIQPPASPLNLDSETDFRSYVHISNDNPAHFITALYIAIFRRMTYSPTVKYFYDELRARGSDIDFKVDDAPTILPKNSSVKKSLRETYEEEIECSIKDADVVQCSTHQLAQLYSEINPKCMVFENQLTHPKKPRQAPPQPHGNIVIGYGAAEHHCWDWMSIYKKIKEVVEK